MEIKVVNNWAENGESSPFPQEIALIRRLKNSYTNLSMAFTPKELEVMLLWAEKETRARRGTERYLLDAESALIDKIEKFLNSRNLSLRD
jgi:hypothetical protein